MKDKNWMTNVTVTIEGKSLEEEIIEKYNTIKDEKECITPIIEIISIWCVKNFTMNYFTMKNFEIK